MADTIQWLETIGKNAKLRHAPAEELAQTLALADASEALKAAVMCQDRAPLSVEFGHKAMKSDHGSNAIPHGDEPDPEHDEDPCGPSRPDQDKPPHDR
ncbi:hypothetical protein [Dyella flagellata]|uniref:Uncharacterized protein n=1 Tax=Dyella flagellata TaxID=1867833 RepID=A0ABQ5X9Q4_9GAMM|nr:hypothetical protein [Dyella flagellata]GLQ87632.1 hypothetical protein GCM10007898_11980 [Dyella flagellata]